MLSMKRLIKSTPHQSAVKIQDRVNSAASVPPRAFGVRGHGIPRRSTRRDERKARTRGRAFASARVGERRTAPLHYSYSLDRGTSHRPSAGGGRWC